MQKDKREQLMREGFCRFESVLPRGLLLRLRDATDRLLEAQTPEQVAKQRTTGSMLPVTSDPIFAELIALGPARQALADLGFPHPVYSDGWLISKPGRSPRLFWHYDWFSWQDPRSYELPPPQVFFMYYLSDTTRENGCLRVVPGSHVRHNPLHDLLPEPHSRDAKQGVDMSGPEFSDRPDEIDVPARAGDLIIGDARLLHAAHGNETDARRTLITLWYQPDLRSLPERMQAQMAAKVKPFPESWPTEARELVAPLLARYDGSAPPYERTLYRPKVGAGTG